MSQAMTTSAPPRTLADAIPGGLPRDITLVAGGTVFMAVSALVAIPLPFTPVPLSMQTFSVLLVGAALGSKRGVASTALYLVAGMAGIPWFAAHHSGYAFATFGYVLGFVAAAWLTGRLAEHGASRSITRSLGLMVVGNLLIYVFGLAGLMAATGMGVGSALAKGMVPFLVGDAVKIVVAATLLPAAWKALSTHRS